MKHRIYSLHETLVGCHFRLDCYVVDLEVAVRDVSLVEHPEELEEHQGGVEEGFLVVGLEEGFLVVGLEDSLLVVVDEQAVVLGFVH